jgi:hypothetical protein
MYNSELETGIIRGKRQTMMSVSSWIAKKVELARSSTGTADSGLVLELMLAALDTLRQKIDGQVSNGVKTLDCSDFLPE